MTGNRDRFWGVQASVCDVWLWPRSVSGICRDLLLDVIGSSGVPLRENDAWDPVASTTGKPCLLIFGGEGCRRFPQERWCDVLEGIDANDRVQVAADLAGDNRNDAACRADMKLGRPGAEAVPRHGRRCPNRYGECTSWARRPNTAMLRAEGARAGARRDLFGIGLPVELERNVSAVAASRDEHCC